MQSQTDKDRPTLQYIQMDALNTTFKDDSFSVAIDKATIDALIPSQNEKSLADAEKYFKEILRLLRNGGRYICISLLQEHLLELLLKFFPCNSFMFRVVRCFEAENKDSTSANLPVFMVICTKFKALPKMVSRNSRMCLLIITNKIDFRNGFDCFGKNEKARNGR